jgi:hypothetical protein
LSIAGINIVLPHRHKTKRKKEMKEYREHAILALSKLFSKAETLMSPDIAPKLNFYAEQANSIF